MWLISQGYDPFTRVTGTRISRLGLEGKARDTRITKIIVFRKDLNDFVLLDAEGNTSGTLNRGCNFHIKNKLKSEIFNDKKSLEAKNLNSANILAPFPDSINLYSRDVN